MLAIKRGKQRSLWASRYDHEGTTESGITFPLQTTRKLDEIYKNHCFRPRTMGRQDCDSGERITYQGYLKLTHFPER